MTLLAQQTQTQFVTVVEMTVDYPPGSFAGNTEALRLPTIFRSAPKSRLEASLQLFRWMRLIKCKAKFSTEPATALDK